MKSSKILPSESALHLPCCYYYFAIISNYLVSSLIPISLHNVFFRIVFG